MRRMRLWGISVSGKVLVRDMTKGQAEKLKHKLSHSVLYVEAVKVG